MIKKLIDMYEGGAITGYQVMIDCLQELDPENPGLVLSELPEEILDEILEYARRHDSRRPHSATLVPPAEDQVRAAELWISALGEHRRSVRGKGTKIPPIRPL